MSEKQILGSATTFAELDKNAIGQTFSGYRIQDQSRSDDKIRGLHSIGHQRLCIWPDDGKKHVNIFPHATYVACAGDKNFPNVVRVYDANSCSGSNFVGHAHPLSLKTRFGRACRAFVNAWRNP